MDSEIAGNVLSATPRVTTNGKTVYDIAFSDGNTYATFDTAIYSKAAALIGQAATARVKVGPNPKNPQYINYYLNDIAPQGQLSATSAPVALPAPTAPRPQQGGGMTPEREQKIVKQSSFSTAFNFVGHIFAGSGDLDSAKDLAHELARELYGHVMGEQKQPEPVVASATDNGKGDGIPW